LNDCDVIVIDAGALTSRRGTYEPSIHTRTPRGLSARRATVANCDV